MTVRTVRKIGAATAALIALTSLSGCAAGFNAQTNKPYAPSNGSIATVGAIRIRSVVVMSSDNGSGQGELVAAFVNSGTTPDVLTGISVSGADKVQVPGSALTLPPQVAMVMSPETPHRVLISKLTKKPGDLVTVEFTFRDAGIASVTALVMTPEGMVSGG